MALLLVDEQIETLNKFGVSVRGEEVIILFPLRRMNRDDAINLAAYLVALTDKEKFLKVLEAVEGT